MDLNQVALFTRVVEAGSFTAAAKNLGLPVSSVSRGIVHLEESLGARLLQRTTRKLSLTEAGRVFFDEVTGAVGALAEAAERVTDQGREATGTVRLTLPVDLGDDFFAQTIEHFCRKHPRVRVDIELQNRRVDMVQEGFDLALRGGKMEDSSLVGRKLDESNMGLYASAEYLERRGTPQSFAELAEHDCLALRHLSTIWTMTGPKGIESVKIKGPLIANDIAMLTRAGALGMGITMLPTSSALACARARLLPTLERVLPEYALSGGALWLLWPSARHMPLRVALLRDHLTEAFSMLQSECAVLEQRIKSGVPREVVEEEHRVAKANGRKNGHSRR